MSGPASLPPTLPARRPSLAGRLRALAPLLPALLPPLLFLPFILAPPLTADGGVVLAFSQRWLAGEHLYVDLIDMNPPLIFLLNLIPAAIARVTGADAVLALQACLVALGLWEWRLAILVRDRAAEPPVERALLDVLPGLMVFGAGYLFGERETLMVAAAFPYLVAAARREGGAAPRGGRTTAVLAALGFALKPHFMCIPLMVELAVSAGRVGAQGWRAGWAATWRDPVPWVMAAVWVTYIASIPLAFPAYLDSIVPLAWRYYDAAPGLTALGLLLLPRMGVAVLLLAGGAWLAFRRPWSAAPSSPNAGLARLLALGGLGALISAMVQHMGWGQHVVAVQLFAEALAVLLAARYFDHAGVGQRPRGAMRAAAMLSALFAAYCVQAGRAPLVELHYAGSDTARLARLIAREAPGGRVTAFSSSLPLFPAANYAGARMAQRFMDMWLLQGLYQTCPADGRLYRPPEAMNAAERLVYQGVATDFARQRPDLVLVDTVSDIRGCAGPFSFLGYFLRNPVFAEAWAGYRLADTWGRYEVYVRK